MKPFDYVYLALMGLPLCIPISAMAADPVAPARSPSIREGLPVLPQSRLFIFPGGDFDQFKTALSEQYGTNILESLDIRGDGASRLRIPKMRVEGAQWTSVLKTYNQVSEEGNGFLGKWIFTPSYFNFDSPVWPNTLIFMTPKKSSAESALQVRAFPIRGMPSSVLNALRDLLGQESQQLRLDIAKGVYGRDQDASMAEGRLSVHEGSGLLIAVGGKTYVDLVKTVIDGFNTNYPYPRP